MSIYIYIITLSIAISDSPPSKHIVGFHFCILLKLGVAMQFALVHVTLELKPLRTSDSLPSFLPSHFLEVLLIVKASLA